MSNKIAILDAGAQYAKVIDRRVRELNVECDILPLSASASVLSSYAGIIISGGPQSVYAPDAPKCDDALFDLNLPIFGICYGFQLINMKFGGTVVKKAKREDGQFRIAVEPTSLLFSGLDAQQNVLLTHGDSVDQVAKEFEVTARSEDIVAAIESPSRKIYAVQFHPEVDLTEHGKQMIANFLFKVVQCEATFTLKSRQTEAIEYIRSHVGDKKVLVLVSGGVDSSVCCSLVTKAIGKERVVAVHIDHGFMRFGETDKVVQALTDVGVDLKVMRVADKFLAGTTVIDGQTTAELGHVTSPEVKRKIIGDMFMRVLEDFIQTAQIKAEDIYFAQGTLRPDLIESASETVSSNATVIKTHHNDTQLVRELRSQGRVIEPLRDYHKDEVRELGVQLGLPEPLVWRQPFPGPGLAIRIICADQPYITATFDETNAKLASFVPQGIHATLLPVRTVGVQGDGRSYSHIVALTSPNPPDWAQLFQLARTIPREFHNINRAVFVMGAPITGPVREITTTFLSPDIVEQLQLADHIVGQILNKYNLKRLLSQVPVVLVPVSFSAPNLRSIGIRTFITNDFMTGRPACPGVDIPLDFVTEVTQRILAEVPGIDRVMFDLTSKPPATTEWE
eukprot:c8773_g1_i1.p1 GENE.c8773_g1_i1~~c8773_g1_i1.p1  ORF type:complete len:632 (-),score=169.49 c8773_g1_i1:47-1909(-)